MPSAPGPTVAWAVSGRHPDGERARDPSDGVLARGEDLVDEAVVLGRLGGQDLVALDVLADELDVAAGVRGDGLLEPPAHADDLVGVDLEVGGHAPGALDRRLVDEHAAVGQG